MNSEAPIATIGFCDLQMQMQMQMQMQLRACEGTVEEVRESQDSHLQTARKRVGQSRERETGDTSPAGNLMRVPLGGVLAS